MESVVWYRRISFRLFMVTALIVFLPMFLFWNYSLAASRDFLRVEHADRMHTSLYGASLMMQNLMDEVSTFSWEVSRDQSLSQLWRNIGRLRQKGQTGKRHAAGFL